MTKNKAVIALAILTAFGLGACSKHHPGSLRAKAEVAKAKGNEKDMNKVYNETEQEIDMEIARVNELGLTQMGKGKMAAITSKVFSAKIASENRDEVKQKLNKIITNADTQIGLAKDLKNDDLRAKSEQTKSNAQYLLEQVNATDKE